MTPDLLFFIANVAITPFWLLLIFAPRWSWTDRIVHSFAIVQVFAFVYLVLAIGHFFRNGGGYSSLEAVQVLFNDPYALVAGWIHYLVFDLFVGAWEPCDARRLNLPPLAIVTCLLLTFMVGPVGLLAYWILRAIMRKTYSLDEHAVRA